MTRSLGFKTGWMAAKGVDPRAFAEALGLRDPRPCNWEVGVAAAYSRGPNDDAFVVPPVDGWVLCVSVGVMLLDPSTLVRYTTRTAERLDTEVQLFATHRVSESHTWAMALPSGIVGRSPGRATPANKCSIWATERRARRRRSDPATSRPRSTSKA